MIMNVEYSKIKKAVPILLFLFVFSLVIDNSFKLISVAIADDLNISVTTVSWQAIISRFSNWYWRCSIRFII